MIFFVGLHQPSDTGHFERCFISVNRLRCRTNIKARQWIMDGAGFTELLLHGKYRHTPAEYATEIKRWAKTGELLAAVAQDYMCEPIMLERTGLTVTDHQRLTIERYDALIAEATGVYILPVLQGYTVDQYLAHIDQYGDRLAPNMWVGVGSICKRNGNPKAIEEILTAVHNKRPDLRLHGFGLKKTALASVIIRELLYTADSMSWSYSARKQGRNANDWREAENFRLAIEAL